MEDTERKFFAWRFLPGEMVSVFVCLVLSSVAEEARLGVWGTELLRFFVGRDESESLGFDEDLKIRKRLLNQEESALLLGDMTVRLKDEN